MMVFMKNVTPDKLRLGDDILVIGRSGRVVKSTRVFAITRCPTDASNIHVNGKACYCTLVPVVILDRNPMSEEGSACVTSA
jgi:hypothetical protein